jgi:hypothetical protein
MIFCTACSSLNEKVEQLRFFGNKEFDQKVWSFSNEYVRGTMIYDFLSRNSPITDRSFEFVLNNLGSSTGYYEYDLYPAYYIGPKPKEGDAKAYLIAFIIDHKSGQVRDIHIHPELD